MKIASNCQENVTLSDDLKPFLKHETESNFSRVCLRAKWYTGNISHEIQAQKKIICNEKLTNSI